MKIRANITPTLDDVAGCGSIEIEIDDEEIDKILVSRFMYLLNSGKLSVLTKFYGSKNDNQG